jgi:predicted nucleic acid-binding protein
MNAAKISLQHNIPMADSIILATAKAYECIVWTQDADFENLPGVNFFRKVGVDQQGH